MRKEFLTFLHSSNALLEFKYDGWNIIGVSGQWSYSEYKSVTVGGRTERKTRHLWLQSATSGEAYFADATAVSS